MSLYQYTCIPVLFRFPSLAGATIIGIAYGLQILPNDDPYVHVAERGLQSLAGAVVPGAFLVDSIPILKYVPEWVPGERTDNWDAAMNYK